jgi:pimeloyl-ACP methyl ester carboxylesterase
MAASWAVRLLRVGVVEHEAECNGGSLEVKAFVATTRTFPFELTGVDGGPLRGEVRSQAPTEMRPAVVVCHGFKGFKDWGFFPTVAGRIARAGMTAVTFNFSGSGIGPDGSSFSEPERFRRATPSRDLSDLRTIWNALRDGRLRDALPTPSATGIFGHSRGGATALLHASAHPECRALVTWSAISSHMRWGPETIRRWRKEGTIEIVNARTGEVLPLGIDYLEDLERDGERLDPLAAARRLATPWRLLHGGADETVKVAEARALCAAAPEATTELVVIEGGSHTLGAKHPWAGSTAQFDRALDLTIDWFVRYLF